MARRPSNPPSGDTADPARLAPRGPGVLAPGIGGIRQPPIPIPEIRPPNPLFPIGGAVAAEGKPVLRNKIVREGDPQVEGWDRYLEVIADLEDIEPFDDVWSSRVRSFESQYGRYIKLPARAQAEGGSAAPRARNPGWLIEYLDDSLSVEAAPPSLKFAAKPVDARIDRFNVGALAAALDNLLARCSALRQRRDELAAKAALLTVEFVEFLRKDRMFRERVSKGGLSIGYIEAVRAHEVEKLVRSGAASGKQSFDEQIRDLYSDAVVNNTSLEAQRSAYASGKGSFAPPGERDITFPDPGGRLASAAEHMRMAADFGTRRVAELDRFALERGQASDTSAEKASGHRLVSARERSEFAAWSARAELTQHLDAVQITQAKLDVACGSGGVLNYAAQEQWVGEQLSAVFRDAAAILLKLGAGLETVFDYRPPLGSALIMLFHTEDLGSLDRAESTTDDPLSDALVWSQQVSHFLNATASTERHIRKTLSVKDLVEARWQNLIQGASVVVDVTERLLGTRRCPKLVAVGALRVGGDDRLIIEVHITPPTSGVFWSPGGERRDFDQGEEMILLPALPLVDRPNGFPSLRSDGLLGRSPLGDWKIELAPGTDAAGLEDIHLTLIVAES